MKREPDVIWTKQKKNEEREREQRMVSAEESGSKWWKRLMGPAGIMLDKLLIIHCWFIIQLREYYGFLLFETVLGTDTEAMNNGYLHPLPLPDLFH